MPCLILSIYTKQRGVFDVENRWRPTQNNDMTEHVFVASDVFGNIYHVHATSSKRID